MREKRIFRGESFSHIKQCFTGWLYWGRYGAEERQTTGWLGTCRNTFTCQTTNIMEGEPLGGGGGWSGGSREPTNFAFDNSAYR